MTASFRHRVLDGEVVIGVFLAMGSSVSAEICARACDWVVIDLEHGLGSEGVLFTELQAVALTAAAPVVRIEASAPLRASRVLDQGALGIMVPRVETAAEASELASYLRYPPHGRRGVALSSRALGYGALHHRDLGAVNDSVLCIAQIETELGVANAASIAKVDGIDVLFIGPSDLTHALGIPGEFDHPDYDAALRAVVEGASNAGKACGILAANLPDFERYVDLGFTAILVGVDTVILAASVGSMTATYHARAGTAGRRAEAGRASERTGILQRIGSKDGSDGH